MLHILQYIVVQAVVETLVPEKRELELRVQHVVVVQRALDVVFDIFVHLLHLHLRGVVLHLLDPRSCVLGRIKRLLRCLALVLVLLQL